MERKTIAGWQIFVNRGAKAHYRYRNWLPFRVWCPSKKLSVAKKKDFFLSFHHTVTKLVWHVWHRRSERTTASRVSRRERLLQLKSDLFNYVSINLSGLWASLLVVSLTSGVTDG